jgi:hypothetical protein
MNLRILKKLSKRAAPYLAELGDNRKQFSAVRGDNYHGMVINDRTTWERSRCHPTYKPFGGEIVRQTRAGHHIVMRSPSHPMKGTIMVGETSGYYEPEWAEEAAYDALSELVYGHFTDWAACQSIDDIPGLTRDLSSVSKLFAAADDMLAERRRAAA